MNDAKGSFNMPYLNGILWTMTLVLSLWRSVEISGKTLTSLIVKYHSSFQWGSLHNFRFRHTHGFVGAVRSTYCNCFLSGLGVPPFMGSFAWTKHNCCLLLPIINHHWPILLAIPVILGYCWILLGSCWLLLVAHHVAQPGPNRPEWQGRKNHRVGPRRKEMEGTAWVHQASGRPVPELFASGWFTDGQWWLII